MQKTLVCSLYHDWSLVCDCFVVRLTSMYLMLPPMSS